VTQTVVLPGGEITVGGGGFVPGHIVTLTLHSTPVDLGTAVADARGIVSAEVAIPESVTTGMHRITIFDKLTGRLLSVPITLAAAATSQGSPSPVAELSAKAVASRSTKSVAKNAGSHSTLAIATLAGTVLLASAGAIVVLARRRVAG
jgi:hypothetical protein